VDIAFPVSTASGSKVDIDLPQGLTVVGVVIEPANGSLITSTCNVISSPSQFLSRRANSSVVTLDLCDLTNFGPGNGPLKVKLLVELDGAISTLPGGSLAGGSITLTTNGKAHSSGTSPVSPIRIVKPQAAPFTVGQFPYPGAPTGGTIDAGDPFYFTVDIGHHPNSSSPMFNLAITDDNLMPAAANGSSTFKRPYAIQTVFIKGIGIVYDARNGSTGAGGIMSNPDGGLLALIPRLGLGENVTIIVTAIPTSDAEVGVPISPEPSVSFDNIPGVYVGPGAGAPPPGSGSSGSSGGSSGGGSRTTA